MLTDTNIERIRYRISGLSSFREKVAEESIPFWDYETLTVC